ncbi:MAG: FtsQ-type POTRA domain-containing protein [Candidatus Omnitrophica bacterium]|nr:FtsQ-type POTRA domain-containing protein [Candidatus Omnitrophota bacterium]
MARRRRPSRRMAGLLPRLGGLAAAGLRWFGQRAGLVLPPTLATGALVAGCLLAARSEAFRVTDIRLPATPSFKLTEPVIGQRLWDVDLSSLAASLHRQQPQLAHVRVTRVLPNTIAVDVTPRVPVAQVRLAQWYPVDDEGFILPQGDSAPNPQLITITVAEDAKAPMKPGQQSANPRLLSALRVIGLVRSAPEPAFQVVAIDARDLRQLNLVLEHDIQIRCGGEAELPAQLRRLPGVMKIVVKDPSAVRYVDIRFADPVIGPRT